MPKLLSFLRKSQEKRQRSAAGRVAAEGIFSPKERLYRIFNGVRTESGGAGAKFDKVSEDDLLKLPIVDLAIKMIKSDSLLDMTVSLYCTLVSLEHELTAESSTAERAIREINDLLEYKRIPLSLLVSHIASSMIVRGNICVERVFDKQGRPSSVFCMDTRWFEWKLQDAGIDGQMWFLGQNTGDRQSWERLRETPNVLWVSINPLIGERMGRSPIVTAFDPALKNTELLDALSKVVKTQAFVKRFLQIQQLKMKEVGFTSTEIDKLTSEAHDDVKKWAGLGVDEIPFSSDVINWDQEPGATGRGGLSFTTEANKQFDRMAMRGAGVPPGVVGGSEHVAEYGIRSETKFYGVTLGFGQETLKDTVEWVYRGFLRSMGIRGDPIFTTKRIDVIERLEEAQAFESVLKGIGLAVDSGIPLPTAIKMYEGESGTTFSADVKKEIKEAYEERKSEMNEGNDESDSTVTTDDD